MCGRLHSLLMKCSFSSKHSATITPKFRVLHRQNQYCPCLSHNNMNASVPRLGYLLAGNVLDKSLDIFRFYPYDNPLVPYLPVYHGATTHSYIVTLLNIPRSPPATARPRSHALLLVMLLLISDITGLDPDPEPDNAARSAAAKRGPAGGGRMLHC